MTRPPTQPCKAKGCKNWAMYGGTVCRVHGGSAPQVRAKAEVRAEVMRWGLGDTTVDPGEVLLRLVSQSAARADRYAAELEALVGDDEDGALRKALIAEVWIPTEAGETYKAGEYVRALAKLEGEERDRCATFAAKAIAAGLAERQVRLAERQGELLAEVLRNVMADPTLGMSVDQQALLPGVIRKHLALVAG